jgi:hypothetical protein
MAYISASVYSDRNAELINYHTKLLLEHPEDSEFHLLLLKEETSAFLLRVVLFFIFFILELQ